MDFQWETSGKGFYNLNLERQNFAITFDAEQGKETEVKNWLYDFLKEQNKKEGILSYDETASMAALEPAFRGLYEMTANSDVLADAEGYLKASQSIMLLLCLTLFLLAIGNYGNTIQSSIAARKAEFSIMRSIGMTKKQLRKMIMWEGCYYAICSFGAVLSFGMLLIVVLEFMIKNKVSYFKINYPILELLVIGVVVILICVFISTVILRLEERKRKMRT